jgi:uncharacterized protein (TIGR02001 family)
MNIFKKSLVAVVLGSAAFAAQAQVSGSVAIASQYQWRGYNLSLGEAVVSGSLDWASESGIYAGIWGSSGDGGLGQEYDLYLGYGGEFNGFGVDIAYVDYNYPVTAGAADFEEAILGLSYMDFGFTWAEGLGDTDSSYYALSYGVGAVGFTYGMFQDLGSHVDVTYSYTDNLSFTFSQSFDDGGGYSEEIQFVVGYSIPLEM